MNSYSVQNNLQLSGPRLGVTILSGETADYLYDKFDAQPIITQFGWQFETRFFTLENGTSGLIEGVVLLGGLEQGLFLPSGTGIIGVRSSNGFEFGVGPNVSLSGFAIAIAIGFNISLGEINFPINFAVVPSPKGVRYSLLFGFNAAN